MEYGGGEERRGIIQQRRKEERDVGDNTRRGTHKGVGFQTKCRICRSDLSPAHQLLCEGCQVKFLMGLWLVSNESVK